MRYLMILIASVAIQSIYSQKTVIIAEKNCTISGNVWLGEQYCGGTEPTSYPPDLPFGNLTFYILKGGINDTNKTQYSSFTTDQNGHFSFAIPQGIYTIQLHPSTNANMECYLNDWLSGQFLWSQGPCYQLEISKTISQLDFGFYKPCPDGPLRM